MVKFSSHLKRKENSTKLTFFCSYRIAVGSLAASREAMKSPPSPWVAPPTPPALTSCPTPTTPLALYTLHPRTPLVAVPVKSVW